MAKIAIVVAKNETSFPRQKGPTSIMILMGRRQAVQSFADRKVLRNSRTTNTPLPLVFREKNAFLVPDKQTEISL